MCKRAGRNKEGLNQWHREDRAKNPEPRRKADRKRYKKDPKRTMRAVAARRRGFVLIHTAKEWHELKAKHGWRCLRCGKMTRKLTRDHVKPIKLGGTDHISNIQPLCRSCNSSKGAREVDYR